MDILRPVGRLEKCSTARHALGLYRSVIVTCRYRLARSLAAGTLKDLIYLSLANNVTQHLALCCGIVGEHTEHPAFTRLASIDLDDVVRVCQLDEPDSLVTHLEQLHDGLWTELERRPPWRIVLFQHPVNDKACVVDIAFVFHHALADGLSGTAFHASLLQHLQHLQRTARAPREILQIPRIVNVPPHVPLTKPLEDLVKLPLSWGYLAAQLFREFIWSPAAPWAGAQCEPLEKLPYKSRLRLISVPKHRVEHLLNTARSESLTLTSLITGTIVVALADTLPAATRFVGTTPYSMRRKCNTSTTALVNQVSGFETSYGKSLLDDIRKSREARDGSDPRVWTVARYFQAEMQAELARCPTDSMVGLLPYISSHREFYEKKIGQPRKVTFEVSNLGAHAFDGNSGRDEGQDSEVWGVESMLFSQGAHVVGPAITVNCASVRGGPLRIALSWQDGVVEESIIQGIVRGFDGFSVGS